ncbi:MAG TPA: septum formation initiator family protein [Ktedonobacteraceae bacterium]|nr:septum formation initiator family protein [Ktedonobacteraceae bacterium]
MPDAISRTSGQSRAGGKTPYVTSAVGIEETAGRVRARRVSLFTQTVIWVTGLVCLAFLLGSLAQAWSNSQLMQTLQQEQQKTQQAQNEHARLEHQAAYYRDPYEIESEARQQMGYSRAGEHVVVVANAANQNQPQAAPKSGTSTSQGFWQAWWAFFFGNG